MATEGFLFTMSRWNKLSLFFTMQLLWLIERSVARVTNNNIQSLTTKEQNQIFPYLEMLPSLASYQALHTEPYKDLYKKMEEEGIHLTPRHYYSPIPDTTSQQIGEGGNDYVTMVGIDWQPERQLDLLESIFPTYAQEINNLLVENTTNNVESKIQGINGQVNSLVGLVWYCMVRYLQPHKIIQIGTGSFNRLITLAAFQNQNQLSRVAKSIQDPNLRAGVQGLTSLVTKHPQQVELWEFEHLQQNDILSINSSHVVKTGGDINFLYLEALPRLREGVIVHIQDIYLPQEYPKKPIIDQAFFWNEQSIVQGFLTNNTDFKILLGTNFIRMNHQQQISGIFPLCASDDYTHSIWMQRFHTSRSE